MSKILLGSFFVLLLGGCSLLENVGGFNLSACEGNLSVCWRLYWDNVDSLDTLD